MSKCSECKYEHLSKSEHPCNVCRWKVKERGLAFFGKLSYFEPKEQPTTEYNVCNDCCYEWLDKLDAPCCECKHRFESGTMARLKAKDCFKPKELKAYDDVDMVNHPAHYNRDGAMECIDEMITVFGKDIKELITERSVLGFESVMEREELEDIVKEKLDKLYTEREIKNDK